MKRVSKEREAVRRWLFNVVSFPVILVVGIWAIKETMYKHHMKNGRPFAAFMVRPFHFIRRAFNGGKR